MEFFDTVDRELCTINFTAKNKEEAILKIADIASRSKNLVHISTDYIYESFKDREDIGSTGFAHGIAMPHARIKGLDHFISFIIVAPKGVNYDSIDKKKTTIFCVILGPDDQVNHHLKMLAYFSRILNNKYFRKEILSAKKSEVVYESIAIYSDEPDAYKRIDKEKKKKLLILILYYDEFLYDILEYFIELDIEGATIIDSSSMGSYISAIPIFASFLGFMSDDKNKSKTILLTIPEQLQDRIVMGIEKITGDLDKRQGAMIIITDIAFSKGTMQIM